MKFKKNRQTYFNVFLTYFISKQKYVKYGVFKKLFRVFFNSGALPKSFISDFVLKSGKTPYKEYGRYS